MNGPNVFMVEEDLFVKRIIMPRVGLNVEYLRKKDCE
jgi:hypothetical protein